MFESNKHGPKLDDALVGEQRVHRGDAEEGFSADGTAWEPPDPAPGHYDEVPGEPAPPSAGARPDAETDPTAGHGELEVRRIVRRAIADAAYPATRNDLLRHVGPDDRGRVQGHLRALPHDLTFASPDEVMAAFGGMRSSD